MQILSTCVECDRLCRDYAAAMKSYIKIVTEKRAAAIKVNSVALAVLDSLHREAKKIRENTRRALRNHEAQQHRQGASVSRQNRRQA